MITEGQDCPPPHPEKAEMTGTVLPFPNAAVEQNDKVTTQRASEGHRHRRLFLGATVPPTAHPGPSNLPLEKLPGPRCRPPVRRPALARAPSFLLQAGIGLHRSVTLLYPNQIQMGGPPVALCRSRRLVDSVRQRTVRQEQTLSNAPRVSPVTKAA
jgi:hypothetical protein